MAEERDNKPEVTGGETPVAKAAPGRALAVETPVAKPVPKRGTLTRRVFILGGFWGALALAAVGIMGAPGRFLWPPPAIGFGGPIPVSPDRVPAEGADPVRIVEGRFWLVNIPEGDPPAGASSPGGLLALYTKCPHLGCTVPWNAAFERGGIRGWFRCPCHASTYTKDGGVLVEGPAPRPMDVFPLEVDDNLNVTVQTGRQFEGTGSSQNPARAAPYEPGSSTPELE